MDNDENEEKFKRLFLQVAKLEGGLTEEAVLSLYDICDQYAAEAELKKIAAKKVSKKKSRLKRA